MFLITFHGSDSDTDSGKGKSKDKTNNIYAFDDAGNQVKDKVLTIKSKDLAELRGFCFQNLYLYVASGGTRVDDIRCFQGLVATYEEVSDFVKEGTINSIDHPFNLVFDGQGHCFVSNQDSNVVARLDVSADGQSATASALPTYLTQPPFEDGTFLAGTFVASSKSGLPGVDPTTPVPTTLGGLDVTEQDSKVHKSVRDVALSGGILFVADEPAGLIRLYDANTATPLGISTALTEPTHILINNGIIYVSASNGVWSAPCPAVLPTPPSPTTVTLNLTQLLSHLPGDASGMTFDPDGNFYVAIRTSAPQVLKYTSLPGQASVFIDTSAMPDQPEFIAYVLSD
ncbi:hypothetical protein [Dyella sp. C9]|uniref:hypothetical protein n=1 Tax=Dyella sp. C9 TaxID=2202154 RepID=UPI000DEF1C18|nr:hypothetical protein [Dyella sp. C9]